MPSLKDILNDVSANIITGYSLLVIGQSSIFNHQRVFAQKTKKERRSAIKVKISVLEVVSIFKENNMSGFMR
jgi:hypothetical protein